MESPDTYWRRVNQLHRSDHKIGEAIWNDRFGGNAWAKIVDEQRLPSRQIARRLALKYAKKAGRPWPLAHVPII